MSRRLIEVDLARTVAIILMVVYHTAYDLVMFYGWNISIFEGGWLLLARGAATLFLMLVGVSFVLSWKRQQTTGHYPKKYLLRGLKVLGLGMLLTVGSYLFDSETYIRFGILHCIGISILLLPFAMPLKDRALYLGIGVIVLGRMFTAMQGTSDILLPLNITPKGFTSIDYFPLAPWAGVVLVGAGVGWMIYGKNLKEAQPISYQLQAITWPGRNALWIYFLHQPIVMAVLATVYGSPSAVADSLIR